MHFSSFPTPFVGIAHSGSRPFNWYGLMGGHGFLKGELHFLHSYTCECVRVSVRGRGLRSSGETLEANGVSCDDWSIGRSGWSHKFGRYNEEIAITGFCE